MWQIFVIAYIVHVLLGPMWIHDLIDEGKVEISTSPRELIRRGLFMSYISFLYTAWFIYKPSYSSFMNAMILAGGACAAYYMKYGRETIPAHLFLVFFNIINGLKYMNAQTWLTTVLIGFYTIMHEKLYKP